MQKRNSTTYINQIKPLSVWVQFYRLSIQPKNVHTMHNIHLNHIESSDDCVSGARI